MHDINNLENFLFQTNFQNENNNDDNKKNDKSNIDTEKILCNHCGRTANNGIRCQGICVADNEY